MSAVIAGRVAPAGPMPRYVQRLLSLAPEVRDPQRQQVLTDRFLAPALPAIETLLLRLRAELDPGLRRMRPGSAAYPYPIGCCEEITRAVLPRLRSLDPAALSGPAAEGAAALRGFLAAGGALHRAWGDLRGEYFQNALVAGTLYVDVSNDTVDAAKPPVEIKPFAEAAFLPVAGYGHFARVARRYWTHRILPNHLAPELAPYLPLLHISAEGQVSLGASNAYMLGLTLSQGFAPSARALSAPPMPAGLFAGLAAGLREGPVALPASPEAGREAALAACRAYRDEGRADSAAAFRRAIAAGREVDRRLARLRVSPVPGPSRA